MLPGEVPSDLDVEDENHDSLVGRWTILVDLQAEFGGAFRAYLLFAFLIPGLLFASAYFGWTDRPSITLAAAFVVFVVLLTVSLYSFVWYRWAKKRQAKTYQLMLRKG